MSDEIHARIPNELRILPSQPQQETKVAPKQGQNFSGHALRTLQANISDALSNIEKRSSVAINESPYAKFLDMEDSWDTPSSHYGRLPDTERPPSLNLTGKLETPALEQKGEVLRKEAKHVGQTMPRIIGTINEKNTYGQIPKMSQYGRLPEGWNQQADPTQQKVSTQPMPPLKPTSQKTNQVKPSPSELESYNENIAFMKTQLKPLAQKMNQLINPSTRKAYSKETQQELIGHFKTAITTMEKLFPKRVIDKLNELLEKVEATQTSSVPVSNPAKPPPKIPEGFKQEPKLFTNLSRDGAFKILGNRADGSAILRLESSKVILVTKQTIDGMTTFSEREIKNPNGIDRTKLLTPKSQTPITKPTINGPGRPLSTPPLQPQGGPRGSSGLPIPDGFKRDPRLWKSLNNDTAREALMGKPRNSAILYLDPETQQVTALTKTYDASGNVGFNKKTINTPSELETNYKGNTFIRA